MTTARFAPLLALALAACQQTPSPSPSPSPIPGPALPLTTFTDSAPPAPGTTPIAAAPATDSGPVPIAEAVKGIKGKGPLVAKIEVETSGLKGVFACELFEDKAPLTVANFVALARGLRPWKDKSGAWVKKPLYDGTLFHRVIPDFMIQGGDPDGTGKGGPGYEFDDETRPDLTMDKGGILAMANKGLNRTTGHGTNGSQFFITEKEAPWLNGRHTVFGLCDNLDLEKKLARVPADPRMNRPQADVVIKKVTIQRGRK